MIASLVSLLGSVTSLISGLVAFWRENQLRKDGQTEQIAVDQGAELKRVQDAKTISDNVDTASDDDVARQLREFTRK
jgi:hypothetical protein